MRLAVASNSSCRIIDLGLRDILIGPSSPADDQHSAIREQHGRVADTPRGQSAGRREFAGSRIIEFGLRDKFAVPDHAASHQGVSVAQRGGRASRPLRPHRWHPKGGRIRRLHQQTSTSTSRGAKPARLALTVFWQLLTPFLLALPPEVASIWP